MKGKHGVVMAQKRPAFLHRGRASNRRPGRGRSKRRGRGGRVGRSGVGGNAGAVWRAGGTGDGALLPQAGLVSGRT